jgi:RimJ/RimL family protein N-acetyltransferase
MVTRELSTTHPTVRLVKPNLERDPPLSVAWLADPHGRQTLQLMGVMDSLNQASNLEQETRRVQGFLENPGQYNWMIQFRDHIVGSVWVDRYDSKKIKAPTISIMVGDPSARGQGIGQAVLQAVIDYLHAEGHQVIYACHTSANQASADLLRRLGFQPDGPPYTDPDDHLIWQNLVLSLN